MAHRNKIQKRRKTVDTIERPDRIRRYKYYFLIVCEDENTEPEYFNSFKKYFPRRTLYLENIGTGRDPLGVVEQSVKERDKLIDRTRKTIDKVWVVFDKDDAQISESRILRFDKAYSIALSENIEIALSNEVFELWLLIHFEDVDSNQEIPRAGIYERLERAINLKLEDSDDEFIYEHGKSSVLNFVLKFGDENAAIRRATELRKAHIDKEPIYRNPSTDVDILVKELRSWINYYNY